MWDYPRPPVVLSNSRQVEVRHGDRLVATTVRALRVCETASPPTFYLPSDDVRRDALRPAAGQSFCEWKGQAAYWSLLDSEVPVAWSYAAPSLSFAALRGCVSFYPGRIECYVDGERVRPQPGGFYGGWITSDIVGPFKGEPGTGHW